MQQSINYFTLHGSTVFISALDASKAFDRICHVKLFDKLCKRNFPACLILVLRNWYSKLSSCVRWNSVLSEPFTVSQGVRQGGVLSPFLFNIYIDDLITLLESNGLGCHVAREYIGVIMYADDILLLSASVSGLQNMLDICDTYGVSNFITFNHRKSVCMKVGPNWRKPAADMFLGNMKLEWVTSIKYLGIVFNSGFKLQIDTSYIRRKFYASCNSILAHCKSADEFVRLSLVKSFCLPLLCYCLGALELSSQQVQGLSVCWNDCFRRIFGFRRFESVKCLQFYCNELPFVYMYDLYKWKVLTPVSSVHNRFVALYNINRHVINNFNRKYGAAKSHEQMKCAVYEHFFSSVCFD